MQHELKLHRIILVAAVVLAASFVALMFHMRISLMDERVKEIAALILLISAAGALITLSALEGSIALEFTRKHPREFHGYLLLGAFSLVAGLYLGISEAASLQTVALVASPYAFLFGLAQLRIGLHLAHHGSYRNLFTLNGAIEIMIGGVLLFAARSPVEEAATILGYASVLTAMQIVPFLLHPRLGAKRGSRPRQRSV